VRESRRNTFFLAIYKASLCLRTQNEIFNGSNGLLSIKFIHADRPGIAEPTPIAKQLYSYITLHIPGRKKSCRHLTMPGTHADISATNIVPLDL
jgi:hypothetical protein